jgi:outer membrane protein OmpA-like peptidoglycan-associated protein
MVSKGIKKDRVISKGYGETKPLIPDAATEEDFQKNRRTEFKILKVAGMK